MLMRTLLPIRIASPSVCPSQVGIQFSLALFVLFCRGWAIGMGEPTWGLFVTKVAVLSGDGKDKDGWTMTLMMMVMVVSLDQTCERNDALG